MIQRNSFFQKYLIVSARVNPVGQKNHAFPRIHIHQNRGSGKAGMIQDMISVFLVPSQTSIFERGIQNRLEHPFAEQSSVPLQIRLHETHQIRKRGKASICSRRSSRQGLVQAQTLARCSRKKRDRTMLFNIILSLSYILDSSGHMPAYAMQFIFRSSISGTDL